MKTITVKGVGTASATPDYVIISLGITSKSSEYATAVANANSRIQMLQESFYQLKEDLFMSRWLLNKIQ